VEQVGKSRGGEKPDIGGRREGTIECARGDRERSDGGALRGAGRRAGVCGGM
jgi:hypothetical protein